MSALTSPICTNAGKLGAPAPCIDTGSVGYDSDNHPNSDSSATPPHTNAAGEYTFPDGVVRAVETGVLSLKLSPQGEGGTYLVVSTDSSSGRPPIAVFKPANEEIGTSENPHNNDTCDKDGFVPGEGYKCEELAYLLDHGHFAGVPETRVVTMSGKTGSMQKFIPQCIESWNTMPGPLLPSHVHRIAILDIRLLNCDRHGGNILVAADGKSLVPIDHSYVLPHEWSDPEFEWMEWPQAKLPFSEEELEYIANLDGEKDKQLVDENLGEDCAEIIAVTTTVLQIAARRGYTAKNIAEFCRRQTLTQPSGLELLMAECRDANWDLDLSLAIDRIEEAFPEK